MEDARNKYELLVIGGSAGSLSMVLKLLPLLKKEMNVAMVMVFHRKQTDDTMLVDMFSSRTEYAVKEADDKDELTPGTIFIAPADYHLLIEKNKTLTLDASEKIHYSRPSIDVTFETGADAYGQKMIGMLLSGANADGVEGLITAKKLGSLIIVQDPACAEVPYMPQQAVEKVPVDLLLSYDNLPLFSALFHKGRL